MNYGNNVGIVPLTDAAGITQIFKPNKHYGVDIGFYKQRGCDVLAWQDGKVIAKGYYSDTGYWVALEHTYSSTKRWTVYIHLKASSVTVGQKVTIGQKIGNRGNTGKSTGEHLHLYLTSEIAKSITFNFTNLKKYAIDPVPYLYYSRQFNTVYISANSWKKELPDPIPDVVNPVSRDTDKDQLICHEDNLRVRNKPSLKGDKLGHLVKDAYYNYYAMQDADGYKWYQIADAQWVAGIDSLEILPKRVDYIVVEGDTLKSIAEKYGTTVEKIVELNPELIQVGCILRVK